MIAELLVELVAERLYRCHGDAVTGMDAHWIDVLNRADDDNRVVSISHQLQLELAPAQHGFLDQDLVDRARGKALRDDLAQLGLGIR